MNNPKDRIFAGLSEDESGAVATNHFLNTSVYSIKTSASAKGAAKLVIYVDSVKSAGYASVEDAYTNGPASIELTNVELKIELNPEE